MENELLEETGYVGDIPEGWKWVKLGDLVEIIKGKKPENLIENPSKNTLPYLTAEYLRYKTPNQFVDIEKEKKLPVCEKDDIILIWDGSQAGQVFTGSKGILASTMVKIIPNLDIVNKAYLYFFLTTKFEYLNTQTTGSAIPHVNKNAFLNLPIPLPPLPEQKAIAEVLSSIDDKIELLHRQNKTLEEMAMTLFRQWFIEPTKDGLPEGWEEVKIGDVLEVVLGGTPSTRIAEYWNGDIPWINSGEINNFRITKATKYITVSVLRNSNTKLMPKGSTVLAITGATLGKVSLLEIDTCANQSVIGIIPNDIFPKEYIYLWIKYKIDEIILNETGGAQPHINQNDVRNTVIIKPIKEYLNEKNQVLENIFLKITNNVFQIQTLEKLRDTLLPKLMSGEVRVKF